jgi:hypothetical protein
VAWWFSVLFTTRDESGGRGHCGTVIPHPRSDTARRRESKQNFSTDFKFRANVHLNPASELTIFLFRFPSPKEIANALQTKAGQLYRRLDIEGITAYWVRPSQENPRGGNL